jgi:hypothetical protein
MIDQPQHPVAPWGWGCAPWIDVADQDVNATILAASPVSSGHRAAGSGPIARAGTPSRLSRRWRESDPHLRIGLGPAEHAVGATTASRGISRPIARASSPQMTSATSARLLGGPRIMIPRLAVIAVDQQGIDALAQQQHQPGRGDPRALTFAVSAVDAVLVMSLPRSGPLSRKHRSASTSATLVAEGRHSWQGRTLRESSAPTSPHSRRRRPAWSEPQNRMPAAAQAGLASPGFDFSSIPVPPAEERSTNNR